MTAGRDFATEGIALIAVLFALALLMLLALPFTIGMSAGFDSAVQSADERGAALASTGVRDKLIADASLSHPALDPTPAADGLDEYPDHWETPEKLARMEGDGRFLLGGEIEDLQRRIDLNTATPLVLANLIGTTARLAEPLEKDSNSIVLQGGENLPPDGFVMVDFELIHYGSRRGGVLEDLQRGLLAPENAFADESHEVPAGALVLDYRCVVAASWPFDGRAGADRTRRVPYETVLELAEIARAGFGSFDAREMEVFERTLCTRGGHAQSPIFGRAERVFTDLIAENKDRLVRVESGLHCGAGSTVRLRDLRTGAVEYGLVLQASNPRQAGARDLMLPSEVRLLLHLPVRRDFPAMDTVVEPLLPVPVNVNTAGKEVLAALFGSLGRGFDVRAHDGSGGQRPTPPAPISGADALALAARIEEARRPGLEGIGGPFRGWQDFVERLFKPLLDEDENQEQKQRLLLLYRALLTGRDARLEMGTMPISFTSGPWVRYRAAASASRSALASSVSARSEREGVAAAVPGFPLEESWRTQDRLEECFRLDRRAPGYITAPVNTGAILPGQLGDDPASRLNAHVLAYAYPDIGLGQPRFPSRDPADSGFVAAPATAPAGSWAGEPVAHESFALALDPRGRDLGREGVYRARNTGPAPGGVEAQPARGHSLSFPFTIQDGLAGRFGTSFWIVPEDLGDATWFDYSDGDPERNRIRLAIEDSVLKLEVLDEAGIDPDPSLSATQVSRTAGEWTVPVAELGLPAGTPLHCSFAAYGNRPDELSLLIDGFPRGRPRYLTHLEAPIAAYDPTIRPPSLPGEDPEKYLDITVESTEGFPPQGVLRIGLELFEYTSIQGNTFRCAFEDSRGGRSARQILREFRPDIPTGPDGEPTIDVDDLRQQGVNLDVAPEHPVGSGVELYGYTSFPYPDTALQVGETRLADPVGGFAVARAWVRNARAIDVALPPPANGSLPIGRGLDETSAEDIELFDPVVTTGNAAPNAKRQEVLDAFPASGGYCLLVQFKFPFQASTGPTAPTTSTEVTVGGIEPIRYSSRQGNRLVGIQRNARIPGDDSRISNRWYDGRPHRFVTDWEDSLTIQRGQIPYDEVPNFLLFVVPITLPVQNPAMLVDPQDLGQVEWVQLYPRGGDENDTEFVCYDAILDGRHIARGNRRSWDRVRRRLTGQINETTITIFRGTGPNRDPAMIENPWGTVQATSGHIGYVPQLESDLPQIFHARMALSFRGDARTGTSSHAHPNSVVLPCHRIQLHWGNFGAMTGRAGRQDRVALIAISQGTGAGGRPPVEWHTVNWVWRRFGSDNLQRDRSPAELLGPWPFQLVAFKEPVQHVILGPPRDRNAASDPRLHDRMVKFPSGELPSAYVPEILCGGSAAGGDPARGILDEVHVSAQPARDVALDESMTADARTFTVRPTAYLMPDGMVSSGGDASATFPEGGGLVQIDREVLAYQSRADGVFTVAGNGRGFLGTEARAHDRGAIVRFLGHVPAAVLSSGLSAQGDSLHVQALGAMPARGGAVLAGDEVLHYTWVRRSGDQFSLEMPRYRDETDTAGRGLFRGRFGTTPAVLSQGDAVIAFPFRYWDRRVERSDDPDLHYFQISSRQSRVFWKSITWREEVRDPLVDVECLSRLDGRPSFAAADDPLTGLFRFTRDAGDDRPSIVGREGSLLEMRFSTIYRTGCLDVVTHLAHGYKTAARVRDVRVEYEGATRILEERVTIR